MLVKNSNDTTGKGTHHLLACSAVPQPPVPPSVPGYPGWYDVKMFLAFKRYVNNNILTLYQPQYTDYCIYSCSFIYLTLYIHDPY